MASALSQACVVTGGVAQLRSKLIEIAPASRVVSFDVFDTLVERCVEPPDQIKWLAVRNFLLSIRRPPLAWTIQHVVELRARVEEGLRQRSRADGGDGECRFTDIAEGMAGHLAEQAAELGAAPIKQALIEGELAAETRALQVKAGMKDLLCELRSKDIRLVAVSDMYLDGVLLREILQRLDLAPQLDAIYVSADHGVGKHSGRLFRRVLELEQIAPSDLLHVGDHEHSDYSTPRSMGIAAIHFHDAARSGRQDLMKAYKWLSGRNRFWCGAHMLGDLEPPSNEDPLVQYGYRVLGPVFAIYVARLRELLAQREIETVYFLAREGELFREIYDLFSARQSDFREVVPSRYLHVSRKAVTLPASYQGISRSMLFAYRPWMHERGLAALASALGIAPAAFDDVARSLDLPSVETPIRKPHAHWLERLVNHEGLQGVIREHAPPARELLRAYLEQEGMFGAGRRVAVADIGWAGTIQRGITDAFGAEPFWPHLSGYYLSFEDTNDYRFTMDEALGVLFDRRRDHFRDSVFHPFEELFENGARALHGSTVGYRRDSSGRIAPVLHDESSTTRVAERRSDEITAALRRGALAFAADFADRHAVYGYGADDLVPYALETARRAVFFPTKEEVERLLLMVHVDEAVSDGVLDMSRFQASASRLVSDPLETLRMLRRSNWRYGTSRSIGVPGLNHALRGVHLLAALRTSVLADRPIRWQALAPRPKLWEVAALSAARHGGLALRRRLKT